MHNNFYGGITYPNTSFIFDKIYQSYKDASENCSIDNVLVGRYILIKYHPTMVYTFDDQLKIINNPLVEGEEAIWRENYEKDNPNNYDTVVCKKSYQDSSLIYTPVAHLGTSYSTSYVDDSIGDLGINPTTSKKNTVKEYTDNIYNILNQKDIEFQEQINTWTGILNDDKDKSIRTIAAEELAKQLIPENASDALNELQEIADWIQQHPQDAAAMNTEIENNKKSIEENEKSIQDNANEINNINNEIDSLQFISVVDNKPENINEAIATLIYSIPSEDNNFRELYCIETINGNRQWKLLGYTSKLSLQWETF